MCLMWSLAAIMLKAMATAKEIAAASTPEVKATSQPSPTTNLPQIDEAGESQW